MSTEDGWHLKPKIILTTKTEEAAVFSPSSEADDSSESHELTLVLPNPTVRYRVHNSTRVLSTSSQTNPLHILPFRLFNLPLLSTPWFPNQKQVRIFPFPRGVPLPRNPKFLEFFPSPKVFHSPEIQNFLNFSLPQRCSTPRQSKISWILSPE